MTKTYLLGVDVGTTRVKAILFDTKGRKVFSAWQNCGPNIVDNHSELDMAALWTKTASTIKDVVSQSGTNSDIAAVAVSGQGEGLWLIDKKGNPVEPAILWNDGRAATLVEKLEQQNGLSASVRAITGSNIFPGATSVLLCWLQDTNPDKLALADKVVFCKDWIRYKLTGQLYTDPSDASTSLVDIKKGEICNDIFQLLAIENQFSLVPEMIEPASIAGYITNEAAKITGLKQGTPVATGAFDVASTALGTGAINTNDACVILGTSGCTITLSDNYNADPSTRSGTEIFALTHKNMKVAATMAATPNLDWIFNIFHSGKSHSEVEKELKSVPEGSNGVIYHPYISLSGERAPFYAPGARAQFTGISLGTDALSMTRAVYEGVAFSIRDCLEGVKPNQIFLAGGGAQSIFWAQIIADITGVPILLPSENETCARASAMMAGVAAGLYENLQQAVSEFEQPKRIEPNPTRTSLYDELYSKFVRVREQMLPIWNEQG